MWLKENQITLDALPAPPRVYGFDPKTVVSRQRAFGYTEEDLRILLAPMATGLANMSRPSRAPTVTTNQTALTGVLVYELTCFHQRLPGRAPSRE